MAQAQSHDHLTKYECPRSIHAAPRAHQHAHVTHTKSMASMVLMAGRRLAVALVLE